MTQIYKTILKLLLSYSKNNRCKKKRRKKKNCIAGLVLIFLHNNTTKWVHYFFTMLVTFFILSYLLKNLIVNVTVHCGYRLVRFIGWCVMSTSSSWCHNSSFHVQDLVLIVVPHFFLMMQGQNQQIFLSLHIDQIWNFLQIMRY